MRLRRPSGRSTAFFSTIALFLAFASLSRAQANLYVYVANTTSGTVGVFLTNTNGSLTQLTTLTLGGQPSDAIVSMDNRFAYITNNSQGIVYVIATSTQAIIQTIGACSGPRGLVLSPNGQRLYVACNSSAANGDRVVGFAVAPSTGFLTPHVTILTGATTQPRTLDVTPDGGFLWVVNQAGNNVHLISLNTNSILATIPVGTQPVGGMLTPDGSLFFVTNTTSGTLSVIDTAARGVITTLGTAGSPLGVAVTPDGRFVYVGHGGSNNFIARYTTNPVAPMVPRDVAAGGGIGANAPYLTIPPSGSFLYITHQGSEDVSTFSINSAGGLTQVGGNVGGGGTGPLGIGIQRRFNATTAGPTEPPATRTPSAPTGVDVVRHHLALLVNFGPPRSPGIADANDLDYRIYVHNAADGTLFATINARSSGVIVPYVKNENAYYVNVSAINQFGEGERSAAFMSPAPPWAFYPKDPAGRPCPSPAPCG